ncbi:MAG: T9SS type A sorting domain-containing protein [Bacteroidota bacterium]|nr:T9SS type A sorting domain-containing protein [Bacteroidota bacterium]MDP3144161.1 T9SS type A sorting domain-containing protein [Bacteroidota bacterium]
MNIKNSLYLNNVFFFLKKKRLFIQFFLFLFITNIRSQQIANYITNGGIENYYNCGNSIVVAKGWRSIDSTYFNGILYCNTCFPNVPNNGLTYQWPHSGNAFLQATFLCQPPQCMVNPNRGYFRNRLKSTLVFGKTYCVKLYVNVSNPSSYGISNIGIFFVDNSIDTITKINIPLTYITPQIENSTSNILTDTMNWVAITGTFVANGTEKNCVIGNFKSDAATTKTLINSTSLPAVACDILLDDVSCIPIDLPAYAAASNDIWAIPGNTIYIGRPQDVGIDEACQWFKLPNTTSVIANAAGLTLTVATTTNTYMVKQDICGVIKYDTVVVHASGLGFVTLSGVEATKLKLFPNPANEILTIEFVTSSNEAYRDVNIQIMNSLGQIVKEEELHFTQQAESLAATINTKELANGVYVLKLSSRGTRDLNTDSSLGRNDNSLNVSKRFVISR